MKLELYFSPGSCPRVSMIALEETSASFETHLVEGIHLERRLLYATFATEDRRKGMTAFAEKRAPQFKNR